MGPEKGGLRALQSLISPGGGMPTETKGERRREGRRGDRVQVRSTHALLALKNACIGETEVCFSIIARRDNGGW